MADTRGELAICIPTFNRAELLRNTLNDLAEQQDLFDEVVVSDNGSADHTPQVVADCRNMFHSRLRYVRHEPTLGHMRNIHAVLSQSRCRLQYLLCDDDRLIPDGLRAGLACLNADPEAVAVFGGYRHIGETPDQNYEMRYSAQPERRTSQDRRRLVEEMTGAWLPILVTEAYQRFCYYDQTMYGYWRVVDGLLNTGSIWFVPDMFYLHNATPGRAELSLHEAWYAEFTRIDTDLYLARLNDDAPAQGLSAIRNEHEASFLRIALADAARNNMRLEERNYLLRLRSLGKAAPDHEAAWDSWHLIGTALGRLIEQSFVTQRRRLLLEIGTMNLGALADPLRIALPGVEIVLLDWEHFIAADAGPGDALVAESWGSYADRSRAAADDGLRWAFGDFLKMMTIVRGEPIRLLRGPGGSAHLVRD
jgi:glycosyltransferase involved in cell wall biosynthesis